MSQLDFARWIKDFAESRGKSGRLAHVALIPERGASLVDFPAFLSPGVKEALGSLGIRGLYPHQEKALRLVQEGRNVIVATGTASGKSLCYQIPALQMMANDPSSRFLFLYPTKALAQDQLRSLRELTGGEGTASTYDGDTPAGLRSWVRREARIVLSNPDMLHHGILPNHRLWAGFFRNLRLVVLDEAHVARGVFGSHVAQVLRRLRRLCEHYGSHPVFVMASATIANPKEHAERLVGDKVEVVSDDRSPRKARVFALWNPPDILETGGGEIHRSSNLEASELFAELVRLGVRTIVFSRSRKAAELVYEYTRKRLREEDLDELIASYRGGYLPSLRREIERRLFSGELLGVSATNALELGIDVGDMEACIINGYPGTISSTWQQAGRAGRKGESLAVLVAGDDPLDQYLVRNPEYLLGAPFEEAVVDLENEHILSAHLLCAAYELPLREVDDKFFGEKMRLLVLGLEKRGLLRKRANRYFLTHLRSPSQEVSLRSSSSSTVDIVDLETGAMLGTVEEATSIFHVHPGAVYMQMGDTYLVESLDLDRKIALVRAADLEYYTNPLDNVDVKILEQEKVLRSKNCSFQYGAVVVSTEVYAYQKRRLVSHEVLETVPLDLPVRVLHTKALWITFPPGRIESLGLDEYELAGGLHALEHAAIAMLPLFAMCDRWDIGGMSASIHPDTGEATVFVYDAYPGGIGIAARGYELVEPHLKATRELVSLCPCSSGCPSCIQSPKCGSGNEPLHKEAAIKLLDLAISGLTETRP